MNNKIKKESKIEEELESIKRLLILQLIHNGAPHADVAKAAEISMKTMYKFIPKTRKKNKQEKKS